LIFLSFTTPLPLPGEEGVEVNLGMDMQGSGTIQPEKPATIKNAGILNICIDGPMSFAIIEVFWL